jgi:hypothetical protein
MLDVAFGKRALVLGLIAIVFVFAGAVFLGRNRTEEDSTELELRAQLVGLRRSLCTFEKLVSEGNSGEAKRVYWDQVHNDTHLLAVAVGRTDKPTEARFLESHSKVERGLSMLAPSLKTDVPAFVGLARASLKKLNVLGADLPC